MPKFARAEPTNERDHIIMLLSGHPYVASGLEVSLVGSESCCEHWKHVFLPCARKASKPHALSPSLF